MPTGSGRAATARVRRQAVRRMKQESASGRQCVTLREERRIEEAPQKPIGPVLEAQEQAGLIRSVARRG